MDERRKAIRLSVRNWHDYQELVSKSIKHLYQNLAILNEIDEILPTTSQSGMTIKQHRRNV